MDFGSQDPAPSILVLVSALTTTTSQRETPVKRNQQVLKNSTVSKPADPTTSAFRLSSAEDMVASSRARAHSSLYDSLRISVNRPCAASSEFLN